MAIGGIGRDELARAVLVPSQRSSTSLISLYYPAWSKSDSHIIHHRTTLAALFRVQYTGVIDYHQDVVAHRSDSQPGYDLK